MIYDRDSQITFVLPPAEKRALRIIAAEANMNISEYMRALVSQQVKDRLRTVEHKIGKLPDKELA